MPKINKTRTCKFCEKPFVPKKTFRKMGYCSVLCWSRAKRKSSNIDGVSVSTSTAGAICELIASADLLKKGYEVFRAVSSSCSCDLIAMKEKKYIRVEVRKGSVGKNGTLYLACTRVSKERADMAALVVDDKVIYIKVERSGIVGHKKVQRINWHRMTI